MQKRPNDLKDERFDTIIVGSGPAGATLAKELSHEGQKVVLLEQGRDERKMMFYGTYLGALRYTERMSLFFTMEGLNIIRPIMLGGATGMYCGCAAPPPPFLSEKFGIDLADQVERIYDEFSIAPLPDNLSGTASKRIAEAGIALGLPFTAQDKFISPERCKRFSCGAHCMLGCRCGGKWHAATLVDQAVVRGCKLLTETTVDSLMFNDRKVVGVLCRHGRTLKRIHAERTILCAGGIGTPRILQSSGIDRAGRGIAMDTTVMVYGLSKEPGNGKEPPMTWSYEDEKAGFMLSTLIDPWLLYPMMIAKSEPKQLSSWLHWGNILGLMIKLKDEVGGAILPDGRITKPMGASDRARLDQAITLAGQILIKAGAAETPLIVTPLRGTHPSATVRIDDLVDRSLKTDYKGLWVCDASVFPEALGRPTVVTILALARRLAAELSI